MNRKSKHILKDLLLIFGFFVMNFSMLCGGNFQLLGPLTLRHLCMAFLFAAAIYVFYKKSDRHKPSAKKKHFIPFILYLCYLFLYCLFNFINGEFTTHSFLQSLYTYHLPCIALIVGLPVLLNNHKKLTFFTYSLILLYLFDALLTALQFVNSSIAWEIATRISSSAEEGMAYAEMHSSTNDSLLGYSIAAGAFGFVVTNGYFLATYLPVVTHRIYNRKMWDTILSVALLAMGAVAIFLTQQRMAFASMLLYVVFFFWFGFKRKYSIVLLSALILAGFFVLVFKDFNLGRLAAKGFNDDTRMRLFDNFLDFIDSGAFWYGGAVSFLEKYHKAQHNTFLAAWVLGGVFTFAVYCVLYFNLLWESVKRIWMHRKNTRFFPYTISYAVGAALFLVYSITHSAGVQSGSPLFWTLFMSLLIADRLERKNVILLRHAQCIKKAV